MKLVPEKSKPDHYEVYQHDNGETYVVLDGLSPDNIHAPTVLEQFLLTHYDTIALIYWCLLILTLGFVFLTQVAKPLYKQNR